MQKVLVAEIGSEMTVVNAFGDLDTENPRLLGQGLSPTTALDGDLGIGLRSAIFNLEKDIGPVGSSLHTLSAVQEEYVPNVPSMQEIFQVANGRILLKQRAIMLASQMIFEEVGDVLVIDVGSASTNVYSITLGTDIIHNSQLKLKPLAQQTVEELGVFSNALTLVKLIGENRIKEHHGHGWKELIKLKPKTLGEVALSSELTAAAITIALQRHIGQSRNDIGTSDRVTSDRKRDLTQIRWIVGTGVALTQLPNGLEIMRESFKYMGDAFPQEGIAMLLDRDCIMASLGVLTTTFRQSAWQLLRESFGVEN